MGDPAKHRLAFSNTSQHYLNLHKNTGNGGNGNQRKKGSNYNAPTVNAQAQVSGRKASHVPK